MSTKRRSSRVKKVTAVYEPEWDDDNYLRDPKYTKRNNRNTRSANTKGMYKDYDSDDESDKIVPPTQDEEEYIPGMSIEGAFSSSTAAAHVFSDEEGYDDDDGDMIEPLEDTVDLSEVEDLIATAVGAETEDTTTSAADKMVNDEITRFMTAFYKGAPEVKSMSKSKSTKGIKRKKSFKEKPVKKKRKRQKKVIAEEDKVVTVSDAISGQSSNSFGFADLE